MFLEKYPELKIKVKVKLAKMNKNSDINKPGYLYCKLSKVKVPDCITDFEDYEEFKHFVKDIQKKSLLVYLDELQECLQVIKDFDLFCDQMLCCLQIQFTEDVCPILDEIIQEEEKQNPFPEFQNDQ